MKKYLALLLAMVMVLGMLAGCGGKDNKPANTPANTPNNTTNEPADEPADEPAAPDTYTFNSSLSTFPTVWNVHTYQTATDSTFMDVIGPGFYVFDYNETADGYKVIPFLVTDDHPVDVTADYVGQYGIEEGDTAQVYVLNLRSDLCWQDGTPITANDFVESAKRLLNPEAQNYRADSLYSGNMVIHNAQAYLYGGQTKALENATNAYYTLADLTLGDDGVYYTPAGGACYLAVDFALADWLGGNTLKDYVDAYGEAYFSMTNWETLVGMMDAQGLIPLTDDNLALYGDVTTGNAAWGETMDDLPAYFVYDETYPELDFSEVGIKALSDTELLIAIDKPLEGFYLKYSLTSCWLVKNDLYDACTTVVDGVYTNTYGTSVETTMSYGPYILTSFQADKQIILEKNPNFYAFEEGTYQTTHIVYDYVPEAATRLELFLQGKLDGYGLTKEDMETYSLSDYCYYATGDSTFAMVFNPDLGALLDAQKALGENMNKTIITIPEFRMAMSLGLDRDAFCLATSPTNSAAFGLYSTLIVSDPDAGTAYRTTEVAKNVLAEFWGVSEEYGEGKMYADLDEAVESITGYNLTKAQELFNAAYDKALADGLMDEDDIIEIKIGTPNNTSSFYNNGYEFLVNNYTEAVKGTKLEGKLTFSRDDTLGNGFSDALKNNQVDMLFGVGWTGSALDPYGLMEAYVKPSYQYDDSTDFTTIDATVTINGVDYTTDVWSWYEIMNGIAHEITAADGSVIEFSCGTADKDPENRLNILGALEGAVLLNYNFIPIMDDSSAQLRGQQIEYYTEDYVFGMAFGGVQYYTYNYTDAEWDAYVASQNGELTYN